jgi:cardiolipin synthase
MREKLPGASPTTHHSSLITHHSSLSVAGNNLTLFVETPPLVAAMLRDIHGARQRVWLESYIFLDDAAGQAVADALAERARAGLDVRVHYDAIGCMSVSSVFFQHLEEAGVKVHAFHSFWEIFRRFPALRFLNRRNHRKLLVVDDRVAYFGGMNLVDQSGIHTYAEMEALPASAGWRDVHVRLTGPQADEVAESFERSWRMAHGLPVPRRPRPYRQARLARGEESIQFFDSGPGGKNTRAARLFVRLIRGAKRTLTFAMAYFLPVGRVLRELIRAHKRGVFIRVVVPGESDVPIVQRATRHLYARLLRKRFHIYERQRSMLHSKVLVVDDEWCVLGSSNLDARSLWYHYEFLAVIRSRNLARALDEIVNDEIAQSHRITLRECLARSRWQRLLDRLAWSVRWWL